MRILRWDHGWRYQGTAMQRVAQSDAVARGWKIGLRTGLVTGSLIGSGGTLLVSGHPWLALAAGVAATIALAIGYEQAQALVKVIFRRPE